MIDSSGITADRVDTASAPYLGQWHRLVSTTNWEKGRIISEWRQALVAAAAPQAEFADEAWAHRVGSVSGQHVGRLRRVAERFNTARAQFPGLFWSHFQAGLDWNDAEMWLEGAVQSRWSVAEMRRQRAETLGAVAGEEVINGVSVEDSPAEEFAPDLDLFEAGPAGGPDRDDRAMVKTAPAQSSAPPWDDSDDEDGNESRTRAARTSDAEAIDAPEPSTAGEETQTRPQPFPQLAELPDDLAEAFEAFKLAIVRHRLAGWEAIAPDDVVTALDWLRQLALSGEND